MLPKPPDWQKILTASVLKKVLQSKELQSFVQRINAEYMYWDKVRRLTPPVGFSTQETWAYAKFLRGATREHTPIVDRKQIVFGCTLTSSMLQELQFIDAYTRDVMAERLTTPSKSQLKQSIFEGLSEEAIASSQIEGASTSRKVAREMILSQRKPKNRDEQMILNNFQVMQHLMRWKEKSLSKKRLLEIQKMVTAGTLDDEQDVGRLRNDDDNIQVVDAVTGIPVFTPPVEHMLVPELKRFIKFANEPENSQLHPIVKASMLHFWLAYLHPFVDGNGRTARAIFYWYLLKQKYWVFQYLSVSRIIKKSRVQYDEAYVKSELDENDLTYFVQYSLKVIHTAIQDFLLHMEQKKIQEQIIEKLAKCLPDLNSRQVMVIWKFAENIAKSIDISSHQKMHQVVYQTARTDIMQLVDMGLISQSLVGRRFIFVPNHKAIQKLLASVHFRTGS